MAGIWTFDGIDLRIENLRISLGGDGEDSSANVKVRLDTWGFWAAQSIDSAKAAVDAALGMRELATHNCGEAVELRRIELQSAMTAISSCAFCLDGLYSAICARSPISPELRGAWQRNKTKRSRRVFETLKAKFELGSGTDEASQHIETLYRFRDLAVHPPTSFEDPVLDPELNVGTAPLVVRFRAANARAVTGVELGLIKHILANVRAAESRELIEWAVAANEKLEPLIERWKLEVGPFEPVEQEPE